MENKGIKSNPMHIIYQGIDALSTIGSHHGCNLDDETNLSYSGSAVILANFTNACATYKYLQDNQASISSSRQFLDQLRRDDEAATPPTCVTQIYFLIFAICTTDS